MKKGLHFRLAKAAGVFALITTVLGESVDDPPLHDRGVFLSSPLSSMKSGFLGRDAKHHVSLSLFLKLTRRRETLTENNPNFKDDMRLLRAMAHAVRQSPLLKGAKVSVVIVEG